MAGEGYPDEFTHFSLGEAVGRAEVTVAAPAVQDGADIFTVFPDAIADESAARHLLAVVPVHDGILSRLKSTGRDLQLRA